MFVRKLSIQRIDSTGAAHPCPIRCIDNFAMRNFTNDAVFDDTLPVADGLLEAGHRVPLDRLQPAMEDWFRRKGYLKPDERLAVGEIDCSAFRRPAPALSRHCPKAETPPHAAL
jgi:hypothetical protein